MSSQEDKSTNLQNEKALKPTTSEILQRSFDSFIEGVTGIMISEKKERIRSLSHIFQRLRGGNFLNAILKEWNRYREEGKIKDDYQFTEQHQANLGEFLDFLDNDIPDETRFNLLKKIFFGAATEKVYDRNSLIPPQLMAIARTLSSGEILILTEIYSFSKDTSNWSDLGGGSKAIQGILSAMVRKGFVTQYPKAMIQKHVIGLSEKFLVSELHGRQIKNQVLVDNNNFILTDLGIELCTFIEKYDDLESDG